MNNGNEYPLRDALLAQNIGEDELAGRIGKSDHIISKYIDDYERTGRVSDELVQKEFDRIVALHRHQTASPIDSRFKVLMARKARETMLKREVICQSKRSARISGYLSKYPDVPIYDVLGNLIDRETMCSAELPFITEVNRPFRDALEPSERADWDAIEGMVQMLYWEVCDSEGLADVCNAEYVWDATRSDGKPVMYTDTMVCEALYPYADKLPDLECRSLCMCHGEKARICVHGPGILEFRFEVKVNVYVDVYVITGGKLFRVVSNFELEEHDLPTVSGTIDGLIPGYKYVYSYTIAGEDERIPWVFRSSFYHPLK